MSGIDSSNMFTLPPGTHRSAPPGRATIVTAVGPVHMALEADGHTVIDGVPDRCRTVGQNGTWMQWRRGGVLGELVLAHEMIEEHSAQDLAGSCAAVWRLVAEEDTYPGLTGELAFVDAAFGGADPGQYQAAWTWETSQTRLTIGMFDEHWLVEHAPKRRRLPVLAEPTPADFRILAGETNLYLGLPGIRAGHVCEVCLGACWSPLEVEDTLTWRAVPLSAEHALRSLGIR